VGQRRGGCGGRRGAAAEMASARREWRAESRLCLWGKDCCVEICA
jgi:hypothetical protein